MIAEDPDAPFEMHCAERLSHGLDFLASRPAGLVLLDLSLPDSLGLETFAKVFAHSPAVPIIVLTGTDDSTVALQAVKGGAQDYLVKGKLDRELLVRSMQYSIERKRYQVQLEHQANYDALTGLPNRTLLHDRLRQAVFAQRHVRAIAVVFIDLDHFKFVNDSLGHSVGDELLKQMSPSGCAGAARRRYRGAPRRRRVRADPQRPEQRGSGVPRDAARPSPHQRADDRSRARSSTSPAAPASASIRRTAGRRHAAEERRRGDVPRQGGRAQQLPVLHLRNEPAGDRAPADGASACATRWSAGVRAALPAEGGPAERRVVGSEALLRWMHPEWGLVRPARFIPLAEETGLIVQIGEWVVEEACRQNVRLAEGGPGPGVVSVNLSARQFRRRAWCARCRASSPTRARSVACWRWN
jgi:FixJ family two-component response regulator